VIIDNCHIIGVSGFPHEADAPTLIDADAVLSLSIAD
jgi:hypothetical protein